MIFLRISYILEQGVLVFFIHRKKRYGVLVYLHIFVSFFIGFYHYHPMIVVDPSKQGSFTTVQAQAAINVKESKLKTLMKYESQLFILILSYNVSVMS